MRRFAAAVAVVPLVMLASACGGGAEDGAKDGKDTKAPASAPAAGGEQAAGPLTEAQLKKAIVTADDVSGYEVEEVPADEIPAGDMGAKTKPAECAPIARMVAFGTEPEAAAQVVRMLTATTPEEKPTSLEELDLGDLAGMGQIISVGLLGQETGGAEKALAALRDAVEACGSGFDDGAGQKYTAVKLLADPGKGDESLAYELVGEVDGVKQPMTFTVVRGGSTLAAFYSLNLVDDKAVEVPEDVVDAQLAKLEKAAG